jgi:hypothetical protein
MVAINKIVLICPQTGAVVLDNSIVKSLQFFDDVSIVCFWKYLQT